MNEGECLKCEHRAQNRIPCINVFPAPWCNLDVFSRIIYLMDVWHRFFLSFCLFLCLFLCLCPLSPSLSLSIYISLFFSLALSSRVYVLFPMSFQCLVALFLVWGVSCVTLYLCYCIRMEGCPNFIVFIVCLSWEYKRNKIKYTTLTMRSRKQTADGVARGNTCRMANI